MDHNTNQSITSHDHEHIINIPNTNQNNTNTKTNQNNTASSSNSNSNHDHNPNPNSNYHFAPQSESSSTSSSSDSEPSTSQNAPPLHNQQNRRRNSALNSGLWISLELIANLSQIIAAIFVLSVSKHEHPKHPLFEWIVGYTFGCFITLPHLYWRFVHRNRQISSEQSNNNNSNHNNNAGNNNDSGDNNSYYVVSASNWNRMNPFMTTNPRVHALVDHFKMVLDCFFAVWFVVGNVWIFGGRSSYSYSPNLYRLCVAFLALSAIGYAMPFILCLTICCCLPCIISFLGYHRDDLGMNRGADQESIDKLPVRKFRLKRADNNDSNNGEGILETGSENERVVSAEDAVCCICLAKYTDNEELRELPCNHFFHQECVDKWLKINALCPLCKAEVPNSSGQSSRGLSFGRHRADRRVRNDMQIHI